MKVVDISPKDSPEEDTSPLLEIITEALEYAEIQDSVGTQFILLVNTDDRMHFLTTQESLPEVVYTLEQAKMIVLNGGVEA